MNSIQIDVKRQVSTVLMECNFYTGQRCVKIFISKNDYEELIRDGFFIRDGKEYDSAGVLNTTDVYKKGEPI